MKLKENVEKIFTALSTAYIAFKALEDFEKKQHVSMALTYQRYKDEMREALLLIDEDLTNKLFPEVKLSTEQTLNHLKAQGHKGADDALEIKAEQDAIIETERHIQETFEQDKKESKLATFDPDAEISNMSQGDPNCIEREDMSNDGE